MLQQKRHALRHQLRRKALDQRFKTYRQSLVEKQREEQPRRRELFNQIEESLKRLPQTTFKLREQIDRLICAEEQIQFAKMIVHYFAAAEYEWNIAEWMNLCWILTKAVQWHQAKDLIQLGRRIVFRGALSRLHKHRLLLSNILQTTVDFALQLGTKILDCSFIEAEEIAELLQLVFLLYGVQRVSSETLESHQKRGQSSHNVFSRMSEEEHSFQQRFKQGEKGWEVYNKALMCLNNGACLHYCQEKEQELSPQERQRGEARMLRFLHTVLMRSHRVLQQFLQSFFRAVASPLELLDGIRLLVNVTFFLQDEAFFNRLLQLNVVTLITFLLFQHEAEPRPCYELTVMVIRLANNIVISLGNEKQGFVQELVMPNLQSLFQQGTTELQLQIVQFGCNCLLHAPESNEVMSAVSRVFNPIFIFTLQKQILNEKELQTLLNVLNLLVSHDRFPLNALTEQRPEVIEKLLCYNENISSLVSLLCATCPTEYYN